MAISRNGNQAKVNNIKGLKSWYKLPREMVVNVKSQPKVKVVKSKKGGK